MTTAASSVASILGRDWHPVPGATPEEIDRLRQALPFTPPTDYLELLRVSNGGEGELGLKPGWFQLFETAYAIEHWNDPHYRAEYPNYFFFGSNGGLESIAMAMGNTDPWPIVMIDPVAGVESVVPIAKSFSEFLQRIGIKGNSDA